MRGGRSLLLARSVVLAALLSATPLGCGISEPARIRSSAAGGVVMPEPTPTSTAAHPNSDDGPHTLPAIPAEPVISVERWTYGNAPGVLVTLPHHRLRATRNDKLTLNTLPLLLDRTIEVYRRPLDGGLAPSRSTAAALVLPAVEQTRPLEVYLFAERSQWLSFTRTTLGKQSEPYTRITRGGYAWGGRAVLMDMSERGLTGAEADAATLTIAAHEGWHQYTQRTFKQPLPVWLEEGLATVMEGLVDQSTGHAHIRSAHGGSWPPANPQRLEDLAKATRNGRLLSLEALLSASPTGLLSGMARDGSPNATASLEIDQYYAQTWALALWLMAEPKDADPVGPAGDRPSHRAALTELLVDAQAGRMSLRVADAIGTDRGRAGLAQAQGPAVFLAYFGHDLDAHDRAYRAFVDGLVQAAADGSDRDR